MRLDDPHRVQALDESDAVDLPLAVVPLPARAAGAGERALLLDAVHANGGRIVAQIMHGGRVSHPDTTDLQPAGPSAAAAVGDVFTPAGPKPAPVPRALAADEVPEQTPSYAEAARRGVAAGFDGVELHGGANGYLTSPFLSSNTILRTDRHGGFDRRGHPLRGRGARRPRSTRWAGRGRRSARRRVRGSGAWRTATSPSWTRRCSPTSSRSA